MCAQSIIPSSEGTRAPILKRPRKNKKNKMMNARNFKPVQHRGQYITAYNSTIHYRIVQYSSVQYNKVQYTIVQHSTVAYKRVYQMLYSGHQVKLSIWLYVQLFLSLQLSRQLQIALDSSIYLFSLFFWTEVVNKKSCLVVSFCRKR